MHKLLRQCFFVLISLVMAMSHADNHTVIDEDFSGNLSLRPHLHRWIGDQQPLEQLHSQTHLFSYWQWPAQYSKNVLRPQPVQVMFSIENRTDAEQELALVYPQPWLDHIRLQYWQDGQKTTEYETGNRLPFSTRPIHHRHFIFPLDIPAGKSVTVLLEFEGRQDTFFETLSLQSLHTFQEQTDTQLMWLAMLYGVLLLLMLFHGLIYVLTREIPHLLFSLFVAALLVRSLTMNNLAYEFFWPDQPGLQDFVTVISVMASTLLTALFALSYQGIGPRTPRLLLAYRIYIGLHVLAIAIQAWMGWPLISIAWWLLAVLPFTLFIMVSSFWLYRQGNHKAGIFLLSYIILVISGIISASNNVFFLDLPFDPPEEIGQLLQILLLSLMLTWDIGNAREKAHMAYAKTRARNEFLAKMSHEIRTPINGVLGMAQLLSETPLSRKQQHYADVINHCGKTLLNVINNILEYSRIEAGKLELEETPFNLDDLLLNNNGLFWPQIHSKGISYHFRFDPKTPVNLIGDPTRLQQIFNNIFSNAIKFTDHGSITLDVRTRKLSADKAWIEFTLSDTGIGINADEIEHVFAPFSQANASTTRLYGGSGLGLNITQQIIHLMGGQIRLDSHPGTGTRFHFEVPLKIDSATESAHRHALLPFASKRALILSRIPQADDLLQLTMKHWYMTVHHTIDGDAAFRIITNPETASFDIYCIEASEFHQFSSAQKKALLAYGDRIVVYDCSFNGSSADLYLEGLHLLNAPFSLRHIQKQLDSIIGNLQGAYTNTVSKSTTHATASTRLLVAEDDATNRLVIRAVLKKMEMEHVIVANGILAVERYQASPQAYDIILMDCEMPEMNGYQAASAIRDYEKSHGLKAIPIIALTAHVLPEYEKRCYDSGMNLVMAKPVNIEALAKAINQFAAGAPGPGAT